MTQAEAIVQLANNFVSPNECDTNFEAANVVDGLFALSRAVRRLGNGDASTSMGGMEALGKAMLDSSSMIASALGDLADAIRAVK